MIVLNVRPYCHNCLDFEADVEKPEIMYAHNEPLSISNAIISCKYRNRCEAIKKHLIRNLSIIDQFREKSDD